MGGIGAVAEPLVVISLLVTGTWINRDRNPSKRQRRSWDAVVNRILEDVDSTESEQSRSVSPSLLAPEPTWRKRTIGAWGVTREVTTPNTRRFRGRLLSRLLKRFPFLVECWYWALIYWVYQLGRAAIAIFIIHDTVIAARDHALKLIALEEYLHIFCERYVQEFFLQSPNIMQWINRIYSFIHIPGSIAFLIWLFYITHTQTQTSTSSIQFTTLPQYSERDRDSKRPETSGHPQNTNTARSPALFESRRRTMALCNLLAFCIFTLYPLMPPRLLSADATFGDAGDLARSYGFIDTVHGAGGESSVWTQNKFCNQYAAMPSLHFGYSLLIGLTIMTIPLSDFGVSSRSGNGRETRRILSFRIPGFNTSIPKHTPRIKIPLPSTSWTRITCVALGVFYPSLILVAIVATANHFILDAVAGALVCGVAWWGNDVLLNLLVVEDYFLWCVRIHKPEGGGEGGMAL